MSVLCLNVCLRIMCAKYYELRYMFLKNAPRQMWRVCLIQRQNSRYFRCPVSKTKSWQKSKPIRKLKHANSILGSFEYFCQTSSKSILIISSYSFCKLTRFLRHSVKSPTLSSLSSASSIMIASASFRFRLSVNWNLSRFPHYYVAWRNAKHTISSDKANWLMFVGTCTRNIGLTKA